MKKRHYEYIDILNIAACLGVIFMHCNGIVHLYENTRAWKESMVIETLAYWAVPIFFMISGAMLLGYREKYSTYIFFIKRIQKTVIPFVVWTLISLVIKLYEREIQWEWNVGTIVDLFNNTTAEGVYWFFIPLFMVYLSIPVVSLIKDNRKILKYMASVAFLIYSVYPVCCKLLNISINGEVIFPTAGGYLLYVVLGYLLSTSEINKKQRIRIYILGIIGAGIRYGATVIWLVKNASLDTTFWGYLNFPTVFFACAVFVFVRYIPWNEIIKYEKTRSWISKIAGSGYGIYLMHMIVYRKLEKITMLDPYSYTWRFISPICIYVICVMIVLVMKRIPVVKNTVP